MADVIKPIHVAPAIQAAILKALRDSAQMLRGRALANLSQVLRSRTGTLAGSIYARVTKSKYGGTLRVGTKLFYGRMWEYGFSYARRGKSGRFIRTRRAKRGETGTLIVQARQKRPWLVPALKESQATITQRLETEVGKTVNAQFRTVNIDLKIM
jgi:hypothetical protein